MGGGGMGGAPLDPYQLCDQMCVADKVGCLAQPTCTDWCYTVAFNGRAACVNEANAYIACLRDLLEAGTACGDLYCSVAHTTYMKCVYDTGGCLDDTCSIVYQNADGNDECKCGKICNHIQYLMYCSAPAPDSTITCECYQAQELVGKCAPNATQLADDACNPHLEQTCCDSFLGLN